MRHFVLNGSFLLQPRLVKKIIMTIYIVIFPITIGKKNIMTIFIVILLLKLLKKSEKISISIAFSIVFFQRKDFHGHQRESEYLGLRLVTRSLVRLLR